MKGRPSNIHMRTYHVGAWKIRQEPCSGCVEVELEVEQGGIAGYETRDEP